MGAHNIGDYYRSSQGRFRLWLRRQGLGFKVSGFAEEFRRRSEG